MATEYGEYPLCATRIPRRFAASRSTLLYPIVDTKDLIEAVESGKIGSVGTDCCV